MVTGTGDVIPEGGQQAPTPEERLRALEANLETIQTEKNRVEESYKGLQNTVNKKDAELKKQTDLSTRIGEINDRIDLLVNAIAMGAQNPDSFGEASNTDVKRQLETLNATQKQRREQSAADAKRGEWETMVSGFQTRMTALGITEVDDVGFQIYDLVTSNDPIRIKRAETILSKLEKTPVPRSEEPEEDKFNTRLEEEKRKWMEEKGWLDNEISTPSAMSSTVLSAWQKYTRGEISEEEAKRQGVAFS